MTKGNRDLFLYLFLDKKIIDDDEKIVRLGVNCANEVNKKNASLVLFRITTFVVFYLKGFKTRLT